MALTTAYIAYKVGQCNWLRVEIYAYDIDKGKDFANNLIDTTAIVVLGTAIAKISTKMDRRSKADLPHLRFALYNLFLLSVDMGLSA